MKTFVIVAGGALYDENHLIISPENRNSEKEKMAFYLAEEYEKDKSSLIKFFLKQMCEDSMDKKIIDEFEKDGKKKKILTAEEVLNNA